MPMLPATRMTSAVYKMKSRGPNTEPCGTPHVNFRVDYLPPKNVSAWVLSLRKDRIQFKATPVMPNDNSRPRRRMSWSTVSKAAMRSSSPIKESAASINSSLSHSMDFFHATLLQFQQPSYLSSLIRRYVPARALCSSSTFSLCVPPRKTTMATFKSLSSVVSNIWNALPYHMSPIPTLPAFRKALKHHLFLLAYTDCSAKSIDQTSSMYHTSWYSANYCHCTARKHHAAHLRAFHLSAYD